MPCTTPDPTRAEQDRQEAAKLLLFLDDKLNITASDDVYQAARNSFFPNDQWVQVLCFKLQYLRDHQPIKFEELVYDAHSPESRRLANWWEAHDRADQERRAKEAANTVTPADVHNWQQD